MALYRCVGNNGGGVTPTPITPDNDSPAAMSLGSIYQAVGNGYAIASYDSKTPDDTTPPTVAIGDIVKMGGPGYLYETEQTGGVTGFSQVVNDTSAAAVSKTISGQSGKLLLLLVFNASSSTLTYNRYDGISVSGGSATKIANLMSNNFNVAGTFYKLNVTSNTCTISLANNFRIVAYEAT